MLNFINRLPKLFKSRFKLKKSPALESVNIKTKLQLLIIATGLASLIVAGLVSWFNGRKALEERIIQQLVSIRTNKTQEFELLFNTLQEELRLVARDRDTIEAMVQFNKEFRVLARTFVPENWDQPLQNYYIDEFFPRLAKHLPEADLKYITYRPDNQAGQYLQYYYLAQNPNPTNEKEKLVDAGDGSGYTQVHNRFHEYFKEFIEDSGFRDLYLINHKTGNVVYSVGKGVDYGANLLQGPYSQTGLADVVRAAISNPEPGQIQIADFKFYRPAYESPEAFLAIPLFSGPNKIGILAVQIPIERINKLMTDDGKWEEAGLGETGESYLVGPDMRMRSVSRAWISDPQYYYRRVRKQGTSERTLKLIENLETTVGLQKIETSSVRRAFAGEKGSLTEIDYLGKKALVAYAPLKLSRVNWAIIANIELGEAYAPINRLEINLLIAGTIFLLVSSYFASWAALIFTSPVNQLIDRLKKILDGELESEISITSKGEFGQLAIILNQLIEEYRQTSQELSNKETENTALLMSLVPSAIVGRLKNGEQNIVDETQQATLLKVRIKILYQILEQQSAAAAAELLGELLDRFDQVVAKEDGESMGNPVEKYLAICGVTRPHVDHTQRMMSVALGLRQELHNFNIKHHLELTMQLGMHSGKMTAGVIGQQKVQYAIWGQQVEITSQLGEQTAPNTLEVSQAVYERLAGDAYAFEPGLGIVFDGDKKLPTWILLL